VVINGVFKPFIIILIYQLYVINGKLGFNQTYIFNQNITVPPYSNAWAAFTSPSGFRAVSISLPNGINNPDQTYFIPYINSYFNSGFDYRVNLYNYTSNPHVFHATAPIVVRMEPYTSDGPDDSVISLTPDVFIQ
jgi:hypothetical protein